MLRPELYILPPPLLHGRGKIPSKKAGGGKVYRLRKSLQLGDWDHFQPEKKVLWIAQAKKARGREKRSTIARGQFWFPFSGQPRLFLGSLFFAKAERIKESGMLIMNRLRGLFPSLGAWFSLVSWLWNSPTVFHPYRLNMMILHMRILYSWHHRRIPFWKKKDRRIGLSLQQRSRGRFDGCGGGTKDLLKQ